MIIQNATIFTLSPPRIERADLRVVDGAIHARAKVIRPQKGEECIDLTDTLIMPGLVNSHTHLYSSLSRGMPGPLRPPRNFLEILRKIWWKLDRALDEESVYVSALVGAIEAVKCGTTTIVDHHASPGVIDGSLDILRDALQRIGMRGVLCYEVTDRGGKREREKALRENDRFIAAAQDSPMFRGTVGAHASFTLSDVALRDCGELAQRHDTGVHIHVAEDTADVNDARVKHRAELTERLDGFGILRKKSILAHCVHLMPRDFSRIHNAQSWVVHNPRSNMNNAVGHAPIQRFGMRAALGTDGFPSDMFEEVRYGFFGSREAKDGSSGHDLTQFLQGGQQMISEIFDERIGTLTRGASADLVVLEYAPPTPFTGRNLPWHVTFGMRSSMVKSVMVHGKWILWNGQLVGVDEGEVMRKSTLVARQLWKRMEKV